jgi:hypothetical protein
MTATVQEAAASSPKEKVVAISVMCLASLCFIAMHGFIKSVRGDVPVGVILWSQFAFQSVILTALFARHLPRVLTPNMLGLQIARAVTQIATICLMFIAVGLMQLADAIAIAFVAPLLITALSVAFLKEKVKAQHWLAILIGFAGVMISVAPWRRILCRDLSNDDAADRSDCRTKDDALHRDTYRARDHIGGAAIFLADAEPRTACFSARRRLSWGHGALPADQGLPDGTGLGRRAVFLQ